MQSHFRLVLVGIGLACIAITPVQARSHEDRQAEQFVEDIAGRGISIIDRSGATSDQKRNLFRKLMADHIAFRFFGRSALGQYSKVPSDAQFNTYVELLKDYAAYAMQSQLKEYTGTAVRVVSSRVKDSGRLAYVSVDSEVYSRSSGKVQGTAKWVLIRRVDGSSDNKAEKDNGIKYAGSRAGSGAQYKVYDLVLQTAGESASFSLLQTQRDEFTAILTKNRRNFDALLNHIRGQIKKIRESD